MTTTLKDCTISVPLRVTERRVGKPTMHHVRGGVYEVLARCQDAQGGPCVRSYGLYLLDAIPDWVWRAKSVAA